MYFIKFQSSKRRQGENKGFGRTVHNKGLHQRHHTLPRLEFLSTEGTIHPIQTPKEIPSFS